MMIDIHAFTMPFALTVGWTIGPWIGWLVSVGINRSHWREWRDAWTWSRDALGVSVVLVALYCIAVWNGVVVL